MVVFFQSQPVMYDEDLQSIHGFEELLETLEAVTSICGENIKLIANGKVMSSKNFSLEMLSSKIIMISSTSSAIVPPTQQGCFRIKDDLSGEAVKARSHRAAKEEEFDRRMRIKKELANPYRFHDLETLSGFEDEAHARALLQQLSTDPGVLAVLKEHKWSVGKLCEMYPEGYVGVSDVCILGLNKNKGEAIYLRLRTDDLKGFRKLLNIKQVLYHELAHNEHSDHDAKFYMLMRQIEREVVSLDWRQNSRGHVLGTARRFEQEEGSIDLKDICPPNGTRGTEVGTDANDSARALLSNENNHDQNQNQELSAATHIPMLVDEEDATSSADEWKCPCMCSSPTLLCQTCQSSPPPPLLPSGDKDEMQSTELVNTYAAHHNVKNESISQIRSPIAETDVATEFVEDKERAAVLMQLISDRIINCIDETLASFYALQQEPPERILQLRQAMYEMLLAVGEHVRFKDELKQQSIGQLLETLTLLRDIINRAKDSEEAKYRSLNRTKKLFQRVLLETQALPILYAVGFETQPQSADHVHLPAVRSDPVVLYMFVDILNKTIEASKAALVDFIATSATVTTT